ncbi:hypothetical protein HYW18_03000 [Candidatus Uhrbacteria bacterium]|nr:hypothetical protein [Candidatus Uhrbacteria bacterium]
MRFLPRGTFTKSVEKPGALEQWKTLLEKVGVDESLREAIYYGLKALDKYRHSSSRNPDEPMQIAPEGDDQYDEVIAMARQLGYTSPNDAPDWPDDSAFWNSSVRDGFTAYARTQKMELVKTAEETAAAESSRARIREERLRAQVVQAGSGVTAADIEQAQRQAAEPPSAEATPRTEAAQPPPRTLPANYIRVSPEPELIAAWEQGRDDGVYTSLRLVAARKSREEMSAELARRLKLRIKRFEGEKSEPRLRALYTDLLNEDSAIRRPLRHWDGERVWHLTRADAVLVVSDIHATMRRLGHKL